MINVRDMYKIGKVQMNILCVKTSLWKNFRVIQLTFSCVLIYLYLNNSKMLYNNGMKKKWSIKYTCCLSCCHGYRLSTIKFDINVLLSADIDNVTENTIQPDTGTIPKRSQLLCSFHCSLCFEPGHNLGFTWT